MILRLAPTAALVAALLALACSESPTEPPGLRDPRGVLLVTRGEGSHPRTVEIWAVLPDGSRDLRLTTNEVREASPHWSRDGRRIAYARARDTTSGDQERTDVFVMNANGSGQRLLSAGPLSSSAPRWSPDARRIAFSRFETALVSRVYVMDADGTDVRALTPDTSASFWPDWSPDGTRILFLFLAVRDGLPPLLRMHVMNADGTGERQLAGDAACPGHVLSATWSPDGGRIAYACANSHGTSIYVMDADGTDVTPLTPPGAADSPARDIGPVWSPDGQQIAFTRSRFGADVWVVSATGGSPVQVTQDARSAVADWGPATP